MGEIDYTSSAGTMTFRAVKGGTGNGQPFGDIAIDDVSVSNFKMMIVNLKLS